MKNENGANGESAFSGNTIENAANGKKKRVNQSVKWCFTFHNYTKKDIENLNGDIGAKFVIFSEELGGGGVGKTPHLQGYIEFKKRMRPSELGWNKTIHWEKAKGRRDQNVEYIKKEGGNVYLNGELLETPTVIKRESLWIWQLALLKILEEKPDEREIIWIYEETGGTGKTAFMKYCFANMRAIPVSGKGSDIKFAIYNYGIKKSCYPRVIFVDLPRSFDTSYLSYTALEEVKNGCFFVNKYESDAILIPTPHVVIFANEFPDVSKLSKDRWVINLIDKSECQLPGPNCDWARYCPRNKNMLRFDSVKFNTDTVYEKTYKKFSKNIDNFEKNELYLDFS